jgi:molecular chaperone GrpE
MTKQNEEISEVLDEAPRNGAGAVDSSTKDTAGPAAGEAEEAVEPELSELEQARKEAAEMKTRYLRAVADLENYRKRIAREKQDIIRNAAASVVESLLPVLDNMKLGLQAAQNHPEARDVTYGFKMVDDQLRKSLSEQGLEELIPDGVSFDPNLHECIAHQPSDEVPEDHIMQTVRAGYRLNDRLLRAANVIVSSGPAKEDKS